MSSSTPRTTVHYTAVLEKLSTLSSERRSAICIGKFIQTFWHRITSSRHTMHTKGDDSRPSDKDLQTPGVFIFSVPVGEQKTTPPPPPVSTLYALSKAPPPLWFPLSRGRMAPRQNQRGFPRRGSRGFLHLKGQRCHPRGFRAASRSRVPPSGRRFMPLEAEKPDDASTWTWATRERRRKTESGRGNNVQVQVCGAAEQWRGHLEPKVVLQSDVIEEPFLGIQRSFQTRVL